LKSKKKYHLYESAFHEDTFSIREWQLLAEQNKLRSGSDIPDSMALLRHQDSGFFFGKGDMFGPGYYVGKSQDQDGHILVMGGAGSYKTSAIALPTLATWRSTSIVIDVKATGEFSAYLHRANRHNGKSLKVFNPLHEDSCGYDPYALLRSGGEENLVRNAMELALAILPLPIDLKEPVWIKSAQSLLIAAILYHFHLGATFIQTMVAIQLASVEGLVTEIMQGESIAAKMFAGKLRDLKDQVLAGLGMELLRLTIFATDPLVQSALVEKKSTDMINWELLNNSSEPCDIVLQIPENKLEQWEPMTTLIINQLIKTLERRADKHSDEGRNLPPILILLDEFPRLGKLDAIKSGLATLRSRGVTFALFMQSLAQIDELYGVSARQVIFDNCPYKAILGADDADTREYFSRLVGSMKVGARGISASYIPETREATSFNRQINESIEPIIFPHEFGALEKNMILVTPTGFYRVKKTPYFGNGSSILPDHQNEQKTIQPLEALTYEYR